MGREGWGGGGGGWQCVGLDKVSYTSGIALRGKRIKYYLLCIILLTLPMICVIFM